MNRLWLLWLAIAAAAGEVTYASSSYSYSVQHAAHQRVVDTGCLLSTLKKDFCIIRCFNHYEEQVTNGSGIVGTGTHCTVRCASGQATSDRLCDAGGYWTGERLNCHFPRTGTETEQYRMKLERDKRFDPITVVITYILIKRFTCIFGGCEEDDDPPTVTCYPVETPIVASEGSCTAVVTWTKATATDDHGIHSIYQTRPTGESGDTFKVGPEVVIYTASDTNGQTDTCSFDFKVKVVTCLSPGRPSYGDNTCDPPCGDLYYIYGSKCTATCQDGYDLHGDAERTCGQDTNWTGTAATCKKVKCDSPHTPDNGEVPICTDSNFYGSSCTFKCKSGFILPEQGVKLITCNANKTWSGNFTACKDNEPPVFTNCPNTITAYTDRSNDSTVGTWRRPVVTDNVDGTIKPSLSKGKSPGSRFPVGTHDIEYTASDTAGNEAFPCRFTFIVQETICPPVNWQYKMKISCPLKLTYGQSCNFSCEYGYDMIGPDVITCERNDNTTNIGFWNEEPPKCDVKFCEKLNPPINGALAWENWIHGIQSRIYCNAKYDIPRGTRTAEYYICDTSKGTWSPNDEVPDCTEKRRVGKSRLGSEVQYFTGDCSSNETQLQIKQEFISHLNASAYSILCRAYPGCGIDNVEVECGPIQTERRKRHVTYKKRAISDRNVRHRIGSDTRHKSVDNVARRPTSRFKRDYTHELFISFDFFIELRDEPDVSAPDKWKEIEATFDEVVAVTRSNIENGSLNLEIENFPMQLDKTSFHVDDSELYCPPGSIAQDDRFTCAICPTGTYFDSARDSCVNCPVSSYNDKENQTSCMPCPDGTSTLTPGARTVDKCLAMCPPGSYSNTGLDTPCALCSVSTYQPQRNMKTCTQCPPSTTTANSGSTTMDDCQAFQVDVFDSDSALTLSPVVSADTASWSVTLLLKTDNNNTDILSLASSDTVFQLKNPSALTYDFNGVQGTSNASLLDNSWHHVAVVWDGDSCQFKLYKDGSLIASQDMAGQCSVTLSPAATVEIGTATTAGSFTGSVTMLSVWNSALGDATVSELSSSCLCNDTGASFRWQMIINTISETTTLQIPSTCDVTNNCDPDQCRGYRCEDKLNDFVCHCKGGFTGKTCQTPPDYCVDNMCLNNATCVRGSDNYTCQCAAGFRGYYCQDEIVNGAYGPWSLWSSCTKTCGGGVQSRSRECNEPVPDPDGLPCVGPSSDTQDCNVDKCPECVKFTRLRGLRGTKVSCSQDSNGDRSCNVSCRHGKMPDHKLTNPYHCGPTTNYVWSHQVNNPKDRLPSCTKSSSAMMATFTVGPTYDVSNSDQVLPVQAKLAEMASTTGCVQSGLCTVNSLVTEVPSGGRERRDTTTMFRVLQSITGSVPNYDYFPNGTYNDSIEAAAVANWAIIFDSFVAMYASIQQANDNDSLSVMVDGVKYAPIKDLWLFKGETVCPSPMVTTTTAFKCVNCPPGTYSNGTACVPCLQRYYQNEEGQTECKPCPNGKTTSFSGATQVTDCIETTYVGVTTAATITASETTTGTETTTATVSNSEKSGNTDRTVAIVGATSALVICLVVALILIKMKSGSNAVSAHQPDAASAKEYWMHGDPEQNSSDESRPATCRNVVMY